MYLLTLSLSFVCVYESILPKERYGRKTLLMISALGCTLGHLLLFAAFEFHVDSLAVFGIMLFIASVSIGLGSLSWV